jgi:phage terminase small subunit
MGSRGPSPQPNERKRRTGNPGHRPLPDVADVVHLAAPLTPPDPDDLPEPPAPLSGPGRKSWDRAWLEGWQWLAPSDTDVVLWYCEAVDDYSMLRQQLVQLLADNRDDPRVWRLRKQTVDMRDQVTRLAARLGLDPVARIELKVEVTSIAADLASMMERAPGGSRPTMTIDA